MGNWLVLSISYARGASDVWTKLLTLSRSLGTAVQPTRQQERGKQTYHLLVVGQSSDHVIARVRDGAERTAGHGGLTGHLSGRKERARDKGDCGDLEGRQHEKQVRQ